MSGWSRRSKERFAIDDDDETKCARAVRAHHEPVVGRRGLDYLDGKTDASGVHFDSMCARFENGVETANGLSSFQLQHWMFNVTARYLVFDEETSG
jgi:hypothetical protein